MLLILRCTCFRHKIVVLQQNFQFKARNKNYFKLYMLTETLRLFFVLKKIYYCSYDHLKLKKINVSGHLFDAVISMFQILVLGSLVAPLRSLLNFMDLSKQKIC